MTGSAPFLRDVELRADHIDPDRFPFTLPIFSKAWDLDFPHAITFFVGENGSGKSTLLEAIAVKAGFNIEGGSRDHVFSSVSHEAALAPALRLSWSRKASRGFFLRAETLFTLATYFDDVGAKQEKSLHERSHGEAFFALFLDRFRRPGIYLLDEPEAALSPSRQFAFLQFLREREDQGDAQFIIATHSPLLFAYPGATVYTFSSEIRSMHYSETEHFQLVESFMRDPERFFRHLFADPRDRRR